MRTCIMLTVATATLLGGVGPALADTPSGPVDLEPAQPLGEQLSVGATEESSATSAQAAGEALVGTFTISAGTCDDGPVTSGSYFRMVTAGGSPDRGPYVENGDSPCGDESYTPLAPGADGGLVTGSYQPHPDPAFDDSGNGLADRITEPESFFGTEFSTATNTVDPQTGTEVIEPEITHDGSGTLDGDLRAFAAAWNNQHFNQGAPKPDGSRPGNTQGPTGTYDPDTGAFTLEWTSLIRGGPFDGFTGVWHLEGTFDPAGGTDTAGDDVTDADAGQAADTGTDEESTSAARGATPQTGPAVPGLVGLLALASGWLLRGTSRRHDRRPAT